MESFLQFFPLRNKNFFK